MWLRELASYVPCNAVGFTDSGEPLEISGDQWGLVIDQLVEVKTVKGKTPYERWRA